MNCAKPIVAVTLVFVLSVTTRIAVGKTVSIAISDGTHPVGDGAGFVPANHWNNLVFNGSNTLFAELMDDSGDPSPLTFRMQGNDRRTASTSANVDVNSDLYYGMTGFAATDSSRNFLGTGAGLLIRCWRISTPQSVHPTISMSIPRCGALRPETARH